jgi:hypothetical protein
MDKPLFHIENEQHTPYGCTFREISNPDTHHLLPDGLYCMSEPDSLFF